MSVPSPSLLFHAKGPEACLLSVASGFIKLLVSKPKARVLGSTLSVLKCETSKVLKEDRKQFWQTRSYDSNVESQDKFVEKLRGTFIAIRLSAGWWSARGVPLEQL